MGKPPPSPRSRNDPAPSRRPQGSSKKAKEKGHPPGCPSLDLAIPAISVSPCQTFSSSALKHEIPVFISFVNLDVDSAQILFCADADLAAEVVVRKQCFPSSGRYAFCTFDADDGRNAAQSTVCKAFAATFDPKDPEGLVLYGKRGTGKSFHASCIANAVIERGFSCLVTDIKQVVNLMESSFEKRSGNLERILAPDLLILEDLGAQRSTEYVMEHVYDVIDGRYKAGKPMVITTNFDFRERILNATADDPWGRVFDRIVEVGFPVKYDGNSRRREIGMKNRKDFKRKLGIEGIES